MQERECPSCSKELGRSWGKCPHCGARFSELVAAVNRRDMRFVVFIVSGLATAIFASLLLLQQ